MIDSKDLRLFNLLNETVLGNCQIVGIDTSASWVKGDETKNYSIEYKNLEPIPLNPSILEKCGFKNSDFTYDLDNLSIHLPSDMYKKGRIYFNSWCIIEGSLESLHRLQNLYNALTTKELIFKP